MWALELLMAVTRGMEGYAAVGFRRGGGPNMGSVRMPVKEPFNPLDWFANSVHSMVRRSASGDLEGGAVDEYPAW